MVVMITMVMVVIMLMMRTTKNIGAHKVNC